MTPLTPADLRARLGQEIATSDWVTVTQDMVNTFADATGDHQFIHVDPDRARQGPFGGPIAHGFLTLSLLAGTFLNAGGFPTLQTRVLLNYGLNRVRFLTPVPVGARLRNHAVLQALDEGDGYVQLTVLNTIELEGAPKPAVIAESIFRAYL
ncbi:MaoC family dehydratase [Deinococcus maricopensis]|uniref:Enoyl-CoA hydratase n=1 Tax=Deinococcus maricopensis (strain DSM 21211 / LMG 22137 / NRRL B-23946 / LB-34) TaxID=709986 RepID=E8U730_DEIML|nr:MaoC family dehydratase [Deinococcus maricopensis]ADV66869.1 Enoyl-CoA hydratase [Deinococcus maricopensis DSM 21211]